MADISFEEFLEELIMIDDEMDMKKLIDKFKNRPP